MSIWYGPPHLRWYSTVQWYDLTGKDRIGCDRTTFWKWHDLIVIFFDTIRYDMTWYDCSISYDMKGHDMIWFSSMVWQCFSRVELYILSSNPFRVLSICPRLPTHLEPEADINLYANASGFTSAIMKDLQRIFSCLAIESGSDEDRAYLSKVANGKVAFSSKVTLAMSSQSAWRRDWGCQ